MKGRGAPLRPLALLFVGLLGATLALVLLSQGARVAIRTPLVAKPERGPLVAVPLVWESRGGTTLHRLQFSTPDPQALVSHEELWLFVSASGAGGRLIRAELRVRGTACGFESAGAGGLTDEEPLELRRSPSCASLATAQAVGLDLTVETEGGGALELAAHRRLADDAESGVLEVSPAGSQGGGLPLRVRGFLVDYPPTARRIELLNDMWRIWPTSLWLWLFVTGGVGLALAGCLVFPTRPIANETKRPAAAFVAAAGAGATLLAGSLVLLYAVLTPPLAGPDEPYHLLGFAELVGDTTLPAETVAWMGETHLLRIRYHPTERFRTVDRGHPLIADDPQLRATEVEMRSAALAAFWRVVSPILQGRTAPGMLLSIRLLNALLFALAIGASTALAAACAAAEYPQLLCCPFFFVPALPFFAMHVSETALLCSVYVLLAVSLLILFLDGPRAHWAGLPLGLASGLMLAGGRSPWPLAAIVAVALTARVALGPSRSGSERSSAVVFWSGLGLGSCVFYLLLSDAYRGMALVFARLAPAALRPAQEWLLESPVAAAVLLAVAAVLEASLAPLRAAVAGRLDRPAARLVRWGALALAGFVVLSLLGSLLVPYPQLELEPRHPLTGWERVTRVLTTMATMFRLRDPSFLLSSTFWAGFGWLDTMPGPAFLSLLTLLTASVLVGLLVYLARPRQVRRFLWLLALGSGATMSLVLYAVATQQSPVALQGRYLIGWYLVILAVIGSRIGLTASPSASLLGGRLEAVRRFPRAALLLVLGGAIHVYCLCFILWRYF